MQALEFPEIRTAVLAAIIFGVVIVVVMVLPMLDWEEAGMETLRMNSTECSRRSVICNAKKRATKWVRF